MSRFWSKLKTRIQNNKSEAHRFYPGRELMLGAGVITALLAILMWLVEPAPKTSAYFSAAFAAVILIAFYLQRYKFTEYLNYFIPISYWLLVAIFVLLQGGLEAAALGGFILIIIYAGLSINQVAGYLFSVLSMLYVLLIYFFESMGILQYSSVTMEGNWIIYELLFLGAALVVYVAGKNVRAAFNQLSESKERYQALFDRSNDGIFIIQLDGEILAANQRAAEMLGYEQDELMRLATQDTIPPMERDDAENKRGDLMAGKIVPIYERMLIHKSGKLIPFEISLTLVKNRDGGLAHIQSVVRDISDRKIAEQNQEELFAQVQEAREGLRLLSRQLVKVQESERRFIARELHDEIGQTLTGLQFQIEAAAKEQTEDSATQRLTRAKALVNELMQRVRQLSLDLRPAMLDDFGLLPALDWLFNRYTTQTDIEIIFDHANIEGRRFGVDVETAMYRLIQEALSNVARHASVSYVYVYIKEKEGLLIATVKDTGKGVDPAVLRSAINQTAGITGMRERVALLDGSVQVHSQIEQGMTVVASIPIIRMKQG